MKTLNQTFAELLFELRERLNLSTRQLAERADVPQSLIAGLQAGSRHVGENNARKIGLALGLQGEDLEDFVYLGINDSFERVLEDHKEYPAEVLNLAAAALRKAGVPPCKVFKSVRMGNGEAAGGQARVYLIEGGYATVSVTVEKR